MKRRLLALFILGLFIIPNLIQGAEPELKTIIIEPPQGAEFKVDVWTDKGDNAKYNVGENLIIYFKSTQDAYVYIWDINANGEVRLIFPNRYNQDNFVRANIVYSIPSSRDTYSLKIAPPAGREVVHILASKTPVSTLEEYKGMMDRDPFPLIPEAPENFTDMVKRTIEIVPTPAQWTTDNAIFYVVEGSTSTGTGRLIVESSPKGASISLDGRFLGYTPYDGQVPVGRHTVRLDLAGYQSYTTEVNVTPTQISRISVGLTPIPATGRLIVESNPKGASISLDGRFLGYTPYDGQVPVGRHTVKLDLAGYQSYTTEVNVTPTQISRISVGLTPIPATGRLIVESNPKGASITLDGRFLGYTPYDGQVPVGRHTVRLDLAGYQSYTTEVNVTPNKTAKIDVKLNPISSVEGEFYITSIPSNAEVFINGERKGKTTLRVKKLKPGRYQVTIIKPGYETFVAYYDVFPGQTTNINISLNPIR